MTFDNQTSGFAFSHVTGKEEDMTDEPFAHDVFATLGGCGDEAEMKERVERIVRDAFRLDAFHYGLRFVDTRGKATDFVLTNYGDDWLRLSREHSHTAADLGALHALTRVTPVLWRDIAPTDAGTLTFREAARRQGLECGVTIPLHGPGPDVLATLSIVADTRRTAPPRAWVRLQRTLPHLCLFALHLHAAVFELLNRPPAPAPSVRLTLRERECLRWVVAGKSTWEIAQILGISVHGVTHHVRNVMRKFNCTSRHVAAACAAAQRLI